jgi:hypothetical protein
MTPVGIGSLMQGQCNVTVGASHGLPAGAANREIGVSPSIQKEQDLLSAIQGFIHRRKERQGQITLKTPGVPDLAHIDNPNFRETPLLDTPGEFEFGEFAGRDIVI